MKFWPVLLLTAAWLVFVPFAAKAEDTVVAKVNEIEIKASDLDLAASEVGAELVNIPPADRRRLLLQYVLENVLMAEAAEKENLGSGPEFEKRLAYYRRRALRDAFYDAKVRDAVTESVAKSLYEDRIKSLPPEPEVHARHILVESKEEAEQAAERLKKGEDFAKVANEISKDPSTEGGDLGFFGKNKMLKPLEEAAFALEIGQISEPVQTQFGWHIIKVEEKRDRPPPTFDEVKDRIMASLTQQKAQEALNKLSQDAKVEVLDPDIKKAMEEAAQRQIMQQMIQQGGTSNGEGAKQEDGAQGAKPEGQE